MSGLSNEYRCGYCFSSFEWMTDPRTLPCGHSFCLKCVRGDLQVYSRIECPQCKSQFTDTVVESLAEAKLNLENSAEKSDSQTPLCDSCTGSVKARAEFFCETCDVKFCVEHDKMHHAFFGSKHAKRSIDEFLNAPRRFQTQFCPNHEAKELSLACEKCLKVFCMDCELSTDRCTAAGNSPHSFKSYTIMSERLHGEYKEAVRNLSNKVKAICKLEKLAWRRLDHVTDNAKKMLEEVDKATDKQVDAIRQGAEELKDEIREYVLKCNEETEVYSAQILANQRTVDDMRVEINSITRKTPLSKLIKESPDRTNRITEVIQLNPDKFLLNDMRLHEKGLCRNIEVEVKSVIPSSLGCQRNTDAGGGQLPITISHFSGEEFAICSSSTIQIVNSETGGTERSMSCPGLLKVSSCNQTIYVLVDAGGRKTVRSFAADLQTSTDVITLETSGVSDLAVTEKFVILVDNPNKLLHIYGLNGEKQLTICLKELDSQQVYSIFSVDDDHLLVADGSKVYCLAIGGDNFPVWTSDVISGGVTSICREPVTGFIWATGSNGTVALLSPDGKLAKQYPDVMSHLGPISSRNISGISAHDKSVCMVGLVQYGNPNYNQYNQRQNYNQYGDQNWHQYGQYQTCNQLFNSNYNQNNIQYIQCHIHTYAMSFT